MSFHEFKLAIVSITGLTKDALHIHVGLAVFLAAALVCRKPLRSPVPWLIVLAVAVIAELLDMRDDIVHLRPWQWTASAHDIANTMFWPSVLLLLARSRVLIGE